MARGGIPGRVTCRGRLRLEGAGLEQRHRVDRDGRDDRDDGVDDETLRRVGVVRGAAFLGAAGFSVVRAANRKGPSPRIYMYTPLVGSGELDHKRRHVVPRPQPQGPRDQLRAALLGRLALLQQPIHHTNRLLAVQHVPEPVRS